MSPWNRSNTQPVTSYLIAALLTASQVACDGDAPAIINAKPALGTWGVETQYLSKTTAAGDDFYRYVNEGWLTTAQIPIGLPVVNSFTGVFLETEQRIETIIREFSHNETPGSPEQQIADLYASYMDIETRNKLGVSMLQNDLNDIFSAENHSELSALMGRPGYTSVIITGVERDPGNPQRHVLSCAQGGLGIPGREYYLKKDAPFPALRDGYAKYIEGVLTRAGIGAAAQKAQAILTFETAIARLHWLPEEKRVPEKNYHLMPVAQLAQFAPGFDWTAHLRATGFSDAREINVETDTAVQKIAELFAATPVDTLRIYLAFHLLDNYAELLAMEWDEAKFDFFSRQLAGIEQQRPIEKRAQALVNELLGEQLGQIYVKRYFPPDAKQQAEKLVQYIITAFRQRISALQWMDEPTRKQALSKLDSFVYKIAYPDFWRDYSRVHITPADLIGNVRRIQLWHVADAIAKLTEPARRWEWLMWPQTINAYYAPDRNEIVFPAGILQPPFFDPAADPAVNFGAIGMVIGHELSHGFDDQGSRYDGNGKLHNWWSDGSQANFNKLTAQLVEQYNRFSPIEGLHVNGRLTLGENIGDLGGIAVAYNAYKEYVDNELDGNVPVLDGFTGDQRFFLSYAQVWRNIATDQIRRQLLLTDPHSPGEFRVNGILQNFDPWYAAFGVTDQHAMYLPPQQRVNIW